MMDKFLIFSFICALTLADGIELECPPLFTVYDLEEGGKQTCLRFVPELNTWNDQKIFCLSNEASLMSEVTTRLQIDLANYIPLVDDYSSISFFVGGTDLSLEGTWIWSDGTSMDGAIWDNGQPDGGIAENCACLCPGTFFLCSCSCTTNEGAICQTDLVKKVTTTEMVPTTTERAQTTTEGAHGSTTEDTQGSPVPCNLPECITSEATPSDDPLSTAIVTDRTVTPTIDPDSTESPTTDQIFTRLSTEDPLSTDMKTTDAIYTGKSTQNTDSTDSTTSVPTNGGSSTDNLLTTYYPSTDKTESGSSTVNPITDLTKSTTSKGRSTPIPVSTDSQTEFPNTLPPYEIDCPLFYSKYYLDEARNNPTCLRVVAESQYWNTHRSLCLLEDATLVKTTPQIQRDLIDYLLTVPTFVDRNFYIGANDIVEEDEWVWNDEDNMAGAIWANGEPNGMEDENCACLCPSSFLICDCSCELFEFAICQRNGTMISN